MVVLAFIISDSRISGIDKICAKICPKLLDLYVSIHSRLLFQNQEEKKQENVAQKSLMNKTKTIISSYCFGKSKDIKCDKILPNQSHCIQFSTRSSLKYQ